MEGLSSTPEPSVDDEAEVEMATADLFKVEMGEGLAEALRKLCSQQQQFALPPSPVSNESEGTTYYQQGGVLQKSFNFHRTSYRFDQPQHREKLQRPQRIWCRPKNRRSDEKVQPEKRQIGGQSNW